MRKFDTGMRVHMLACMHEVWVHMRACMREVWVRMWACRRVQIVCVCSS